MHIRLSTLLASLLLIGSTHAEVTLEKGSRITLVGNGLGSRMMNYGHFETELHLRYPQHQLTIRNLCDEGNTPGFRPHSGRDNPYAFPGAEKFLSLPNTKYKWGTSSVGNGFEKTPDAWLNEVKADVILAFFGYNESFNGPGGLDAFKQELTGFIEHTLKQNYNGKSAPQLALVSPTAFQNLSALYATPDGVAENANLALYTKAMEQVAAANKLSFVNLYAPTSQWFTEDKTPLTRDGALLTEAGYRKLTPLLADSLFGKSKSAQDKRAVIHKAVMDKNWLWLNYHKIPNGVHVFGRRHKPYGPDNYPFELEKLAKMVEVRDQAIWAALAGNPFDLALADAKTGELPVVKTNFKPSGKNGALDFRSGSEVLKSLEVPEGYKIELFADESRFPDLANPVQLSFDNKGRLWVATMPSYPHYVPGGPFPDDKLLILEDTNGDGMADKQTVFADKLHLPMGFEFSQDGVYVSQGYRLMLLADTNGDDKADVREVVMSGFDDHDTHHAISAFCADPSGAFLMGEGVFLHSHVETAYGPERSFNGGFWRYNPARRHLERVARLEIPNPWGIAFDDWGQDFFADTSGPDMRWMLPGSINVGYGNFAPNPPNLLEVRVRPTSGLEFVSSRHFPDEVQGDILINNTIGFLGTKQHTMQDEGTGFKSKFRQDLIKSNEGNFRPVDMEFAPDGSLYVVDWHNPLIGHMQHNARDPNRDHAHGRIYRVTYPARPLVKPARVAGASIAELLENLKLPEYRARYRSKRELRGRDHNEVVSAIKKWTASLDAKDANYEHHLCEALWVTWGIDRIDEAIVLKLLKAKDHRARCVAVRALRYNGHRIASQAKLLEEAAGDAHGRVRLEAIVAASWLGKSEGLAVLMKAEAVGIDKTMETTFKAAKAHLEGKAIEGEPTVTYKTELKGDDKKSFLRGAEVYHKEGHCGTCHQDDGNGLPAAQFPPIAGSKWITGSEERLIKLTLHGLMGPIEVKGKVYPGAVPMPAFKMLSDQEIADVLTFVRNSFGNKAPVVKAQLVNKVREATKNRQLFYQVEDLLKQHPMQ